MRSHCLPSIYDFLTQVGSSFRGELLMCVHTMSNYAQQTTSGVVDHIVPSPVCQYYSSFSSTPCPDCGSGGSRGGGRGGGSRLRQVVAVQGSQRQWRRQQLGRGAGGRADCPPPHPTPLRSHPFTSAAAPGTMDTEHQVVDDLQRQLADLQRQVADLQIQVADQDQLVADKDRFMAFIKVLLPLANKYLHLSELLHELREATQAQDLHLTLQTPPQKPPLQPGVGAAYSANSSTPHPSPHTSP